MRIGFDARMITHPGIGRYIKNLLREMIPILGGNELFVFGDKVRLSGLRVASLPTVARNDGAGMKPQNDRVVARNDGAGTKPQNDRVVARNDGAGTKPQNDRVVARNDGAGIRPQNDSVASCNDNRARIIQWDAPVYSLKEQMSWPFSGHGLDIVHVPHFNIPGLIGKGRGRGKGKGKGRGEGKEKIVITIHDLIYTKFPQHLPIIKRMLARPLIRSAINRADRIIAVSENTKKDIIDIAACAKDKTDVIYEAADPVFREIADREELKRVKKRYGLPDNFMLFVGSLKQHKNINRLIGACKILKDRGMAYELVIIGRYHPREDNVFGDIETAGVKYIGEVSTEDMPAIYTMAGLFVMPSLYEGFGLPVLEAMACGVPVCSSNMSSLPEVIGNAGMFFDPYDVKDIAEKIEKVLANEELRSDLIDKGLKRVKDFSWEKAARETLRVYESVLNIGL